jgi:flavin reductase (DIM6/NTAB) family NADH-FMN oxidoreductase RutF
MKKSLGAKTLLYPTPVVLIGSYDKDGRPNIMTAAWTGIVCSRPPSAAVSLRPQRLTYENLLHHRAFTLSIPSEKFAAECDYAGMVSGKKKDKFAASGLTPVKSEHVHAPYVDEFPLVLECRLKQTVDVGAHIQFVGEIVNVLAEEKVLGAGGLPDMEKVQPVVYAPEAGKYYAAGKFLGDAFSIGKKIRS